MPLDANRLGAAMRAAVDAIAPVQGSGAAAVPAYRTALFNALAQAIVTEINANAVVQTTSGAPNGEHTGVIL